jgi:hypothetical protein
LLLSDCREIWDFAQKSFIWPWSNMGVNMLGESSSLWSPAQLLPGRD